ncbi:unnamed protein product [Prorocentrum cordatum]|uniref:Uncharacterized protein n=1 Tax=Prorocentrum cordatum TaxID=2364126 RepID=A0ABN9S6P7_9DINO|nr:unnamed protein product [Polarella glacialis]
MRSQPPSWATTAPRTWVGAWPTGTRMQRCTTCVLGCPGQGSHNVTHYIKECMHLRRMAERVLRAPLPSSVRRRLGLVNGDAAQPPRPASVVALLTRCRLILQEWRRWEVGLDSLPGLGAAQKRPRAGQRDLTVAPLQVMSGFGGGGKQEDQASHRILQAEMLRGVFPPVDVSSFSQEDRGPQRFTNKPAGGARRGEDGGDGRPARQEAQARAGGRRRRPGHDGKGRAEARRRWRAGEVPPVCEAPVADADAVSAQRRPRRRAPPGGAPPWLAVHAWPAVCAGVSARPRFVLPSSMHGRCFPRGASLCSAPRGRSASAEALCALR